MIGRKNAHDPVCCRVMDVKGGQQDGRCGVAPAGFPDNFTFGYEPDIIDVARNFVIVPLTADNPNLPQVQQRVQTFNRALHQ